MHDRGYLLAIVGPAQLFFPSGHLARVFEKAREDILKFYPRTSGSNSDEPFPPSFFEKGFFTPFGLTPQEALYSPSLPLPLEEAEGEICSEMVVLSPPGIPLLSPGEAITEKVVGHLLKKRAAKALFQGAADPSLKTINVVTGARKI